MLYEHVIGVTIYTPPLAHRMFLHDYNPNNPIYVYRNLQDCAGLLTIFKVAFNDSYLFIFGA